MKKYYIGKDNKIQFEEIPSPHENYVHALKYGCIHESVLKEIKERSEVEA